MIRVAVVGATGYTGAELLRLVRGHPSLRLTALVGHSNAGEPVASVLPSFAGLIDGNVEAFDAASIADRADVAFCALPHAASAEKVAALRKVGLRVLDLSADFRLDLDTYREWYGAHHAEDLLASAVYGLVELHREELRTADLVAVPGCYPTASILPIAPLLREGLIATDDPIVVDAKSGVSGAGRPPKARTAFSETAESVRAYSVAGQHRHTPEIERELSRAAGHAVRVLFSPHLVPMTRGILSTIYLKPRAPGLTAERCTEIARAAYAGSPSVCVLPVGEHPDTLWVRGSNRAHLSYTRDARSGWIVAQCTLDNLVKGAAGQAVQCLNVRFGLDEGAGLDSPAVWP